MQSSINLERFPLQVQQTRRVDYFTAQLYRILQKADLESIGHQYIHWTAEGDAFCVENPSEFEKTLPDFFRAKNLGSFVRQLNMYGFRKVRSANTVHVFTHPYFKKDRAADLGLIRRKRVNRPVAQKDAKRTQENLTVYKIALKLKLREMQQTLVAIIEQNRHLTGITGHLRRELQVIQGIYNSKIKDLLRTLMIIIKLPNSPLAIKVQEVLDSVFCQKIIRTNHTSENSLMTDLSSQFLSEQEINRIFHNLLPVLNLSEYHKSNYFVNNQTRVTRPNRNLYLSVEGLIDSGYSEDNTANLLNHSTPDGPKEHIFGTEEIVPNSLVQSPIIPDKSTSEPLPTQQNTQSTFLISDDLSSFEIESCLEKEDSAFDIAILLFSPN